MFDFRYHVASLVAVLLALAVGVLLGVAISGEVSGTRDSAERAEIARLERVLETEQARAEVAERRDEATQDVVETAYPALMEKRLAGRRFALLVIGGIDEKAADVRGAVEQTLVDAESGPPLRMAALELPLDPAAIGELLAEESELVGYAGEDELGDLGRDLAREFVLGGETPLWQTLSSQLVQERSGTTSTAVDGAVVLRAWAENPEADAEESARARSTERLVEGLLDGLKETGLPVIGVEELDRASAESTIDLFRQRGISSVDAVDTLGGRLALALLLAGGKAGHYGVKDSATDGVLPPLETLPTAPVAG